MEMFTDLQNEISLYAKVFGRAATQQTRLVPLFLAPKNGSPLHSKNPNNLMARRNKQENTEKGVCKSPLIYIMFSHKSILKIWEPNN